MEQEKEYYAFISYKSEDVEWAIWLQHELEHYHLPASFNGHSDIRQDLRPVFRDIDELSAGNLPKQIQQALKNSQNLIVVCSPHAAISPWVNQEIETFISLGRTDCIFPFIVEGNSPKDYFPSALLNLPKNEERLGGDVCKNGKDAAFVKIVSGMLGVGFDSLWQRYEREKAEQERKEREEKEKLQIAQSRYSAEKAKTIVKSNPLLATRIAIDLLPVNLDFPDRPYVPEAESLLRESLESNEYTYSSEDVISHVRFSPDEKYIIGSLQMDNGFCMWEVSTGELVYKSNVDNFFADYFSYNSDFSQIVTCSSAFRQINIWSREKKKIIKTFEVGEEGNELVEFFNDETLIIVTRNEEALLWDIKSNSLIRKIGYHSSALYNNSAICPRCGLYCKIIKPNHIVIENIQTGESIAEFNAFEGSYKTYIDNVTFSSDGIILGAQLDNKLYFWDIQKKELIKIVDDIKRPIGAMAIDANNHLVAIGLSNERTIEVRDIEKWTLIEVVPEQDHTNIILSFGKNGKSLLICTRYLHVNILNINHNSLGTIRKKLNEHIIKSFCSSQKNLLAVVDETGEIKIFNTKSLKALYRFRTDLQDVYSIAISNDGKHILTVSSTDLISNEKYLLQQKNEDEDVQTILTIWGIDGNICSIIDCPNDYPSIAEFTVDGKYIVMASLDGVQIWSNQNNSLIKEWESEDIDFDILACDRLGKLFAVSARDEHSIRLYNIKTHTLLKLFKAETDEFSCIAISGKDSYIAAGSDKGIVRVWDMHSGQLVSSWKVGDFSVCALSFGDDESKIITITYNSVQIWDVLSGAYIQTLEKGSSFSTWDNSIYVLNDGQLLIIGDKSISSYTFSPLQDLIDATRKRLYKRELTYYEKRRFYLE